MDWKFVYSTHLLIDVLLSQDAPEVIPADNATPTAPPPQPWKNQQLSDVSPLLPNSDNVSQWVQSEEVSREGSGCGVGKCFSL